jgi:DNA ligase (NAD+)
MKFLKDIPGIYHLPFDNLRKMEGFGEKSITNLQDAIEKSKEPALHRLLYALVSGMLAKQLPKHLPNRLNISLNSRI